MKDMNPMIPCYFMSSNFFFYCFDLEIEEKEMIYCGFEKYTNTRESEEGEALHEF